MAGFTKWMTLMLIVAMTMLISGQGCDSPPKEVTRCMDKDVRCPTWEKYGYCSQMKEKCPYSCGTCQTTDPNCKDTDADRCQLYKHRCVELADYMLHNCPQTCQLCLGP